MISIEVITQSLDKLAMLAGLVYVVLEVLQRKSMWYIGILASLLCTLSFALQGLYANMLLNSYYFFISIWGFYQWSKDKNRHKEEHKSQNKDILLNRLSLRVLLLSLLFFIVVVPLILFALTVIDAHKLTAFRASLASWHSFIGFFALSDILQAVNVAISIIATVWLAKSYIEQWLLWLIADPIIAYLCYTSDLKFMSVLYVIYSLSAIYGFYHWYKNGIYLKKDKI